MKIEADCFLITHYDLFSDEDSSPLLDTWMLSRPGLDGMWYDKLDQDENLLENFMHASEIITDAQCLVMDKVSKSDPKFSLKIDDCTKKHAVVCRVEPQRMIYLTETPKFPCLKPYQADRRKRSPQDEYQPEGEKGRGLLVEMLNTIP